MRQGLLTRALAGATLASLALLTTACGSSGPRTRSNVLAHFPHLGYHPTAPRLPAHLARDTVVAVGLTNHGYVRPSGMRLASDATLQNARWRDWGASTAEAHGTATVQICTSSCGAGHPTRYPATVRFSGIRTCGSVRYYERARLTLATVKGPRPWGAFLRVPCS